MIHLKHAWSIMNRPILMFLGMFLLAGESAQAQVTAVVPDAQTRVQLTELLRDICDWTLSVELQSGEIKVRERRRTSIFINSNLARVLIAGYELCGDQRYLEEALAWFDRLAVQQQVTTSASGDTVGWWGDFSPATNIYLADAGTSASAMATAVRFSSGARRKLYLESLHRFARFVALGCAEDPQNQGRGGSPGWIITSGADRGALGAGYYRGQLAIAPYTISTAVTGSGFFSALYRLSGNPEHLKIAEEAGLWLLQQRRPDGRMPYVLENKLYDNWPVNTMSYISDGLIGLYRRTPHDSIRQRVAESITRNIQWLIVNQNKHGVWGHMRSEDQQRSQGAINLMVLYYSEISPEKMVLESIEKNYRFFLEPKNLHRYGALDMPISTGFLGLSIAEILAPGITYRVD